MPAKKQEAKDETKKVSTNKAKEVTSENGKKVVQKGTSSKAKQTETGKVEAKKTETRKAEAKKSETKNVETKNAENKKTETKKTTTRKKETTETVEVSATVSTNKKKVKAEKNSESPVAENKKVKKVETSGLARQIIEEGKELAKKMVIEENKKAIKGNKSAIKEDKSDIKEEKNAKLNDDNKAKADESKTSKKADKVKEKNEEKDEEKDDVKTEEDIDIKKIGKHSKELKEKENVEIEEAVAKEIKKNKKIPREELNKIRTKVFKNIFFAVAVLLYLDFVILGFINIDYSVLITDLKVFGVILLFISIYNIEKAYKNKSKSHVISAIEAAVLSISTIMIIYINAIIPSKIVPIIVLIAFAFAIYYTIKATIVYLRAKKKYYMDAMKEIIKK